MTNPWTECDSRWSCPRSGGSGWDGFIGSHPQEDVDRDPAGPLFLLYDLDVTTTAGDCSDCASFEGSLGVAASFSGTPITTFNIYHDPSGQETTLEDGGTSLELVILADEPDTFEDDVLVPGTTDILNYELEASLSGCYPATQDLLVKATLWNAGSGILEVSRATVVLSNDADPDTEQNFDISGVLLSPGSSQTIELALDSLSFDPTQDQRLSVLFYSPDGTLLTQNNEPWVIPKAVCPKSLCFFIDGEATKVESPQPEIFPIVIDASSDLPPLASGVPDETTGDCPSSSDTSITQPFELVKHALVGWSFDDSEKTLTLSFDEDIKLDYDKEFTVYGVDNGTKTYLGILRIYKGDNAGTLELPDEIPPRVEIVPVRVNLQ